MKRTLSIFLSLSIIFAAAFPAAGEIKGPQGAISYKITLPEGFDPARDTCPMVILMHGIFSSKDFIPMPSLAKGLAQAGIGSVRFDFNGHGKSDGRMQDMTIAKEIEDAAAVLDYVISLPYAGNIGFLGHSQGGVIASMLAGRINSGYAETRPGVSVSDAVARAESGTGVSVSDAVARRMPPDAMVLIAPGSVIKDACRGGKFFNARFDPTDPPQFIRCWGVMKLGRDYLLSTQELDIYGTAAAYQGPVLLIRGSKDSIVPMRCSEEYLETYGPAQCRLKVVEGENHTITRRRTEVVRLVVEFFSEKLL